jgi:hypothetical protein
MLNDISAEQQYYSCTADVYNLCNTTISSIYVDDLVSTTGLNYNYIG